MVDISKKQQTLRSATAISTVNIPADLIIALQSKQKDELVCHKGPIFTTAIIAGSQAAKQTSLLIPFCHSLHLEDCSIQCSISQTAIHIQCSVSAYYKTGVEMEALTGATIAALSVYDMCKSYSKDIEIGDIKVISKSK